MSPPFGRLENLYVGTAGFDRDCTYYMAVLGAERVWAFNVFGARVAAFRVFQRPLLLLADHRPAPSCMPILAVADLGTAVAELRARGWQSDGEMFEVPNGPCYRFVDPSGNAYALLQNDRPEAMERAGRNDFVAASPSTRPQATSTVGASSRRRALTRDRPDLLDIEGNFMPKARSYCVALLLGSALFLGVYYFLLGDRVGEGVRRSDQAATIAAAKHRLRAVSSEAEFQAVLRADRAAVFFLGKWSTYSLTSQRLVESWVVEQQPAFAVLLVDPDEQPYVRRWMEEKGLEDSMHTRQRRGTVVWLRRGEVVAEAVCPASGDAEFGALTERVSLLP